MNKKEKQISRRRFMTTSIGVAAGIAGLSVVPVQSATAQTEPDITDTEKVLASVDRISPSGIIQERIEGRAAQQLANIPLTASQLECSALAGENLFQSTYLHPSKQQAIKQKVENIQAVMAKDGLLVTDYKLDSQVEGVWAEQNTATAIWTEKITLNLEGDPDPNAPLVSCETKTHMTFLRRTGEDWIIEHDDPDFGLQSMPILPGAKVVSEPTISILHDQRSNDPLSEDGSRPALQASSYNRTDAAEYATEHGPKEDENGYHDFGANCTNFISQCLKAGGWPEKSGWYKSTDAWWHHGLWPTYASYPWHNAHYWYWFTKNQGRGTFLGNVWDLLAGDILQYDFDKDGYIDHSSIVHYRSSAGVIYMAQHTGNYAWKPLSQIVGEYGDSCWYFAWRIKDSF
jgi:hypothetical protein